MKLSIGQSNNIQILRGLAIIAVVFIHNTPTGLSQVFIRPFLNSLLVFFCFLVVCYPRHPAGSPLKELKKY